MYFMSLFLELWLKLITLKDQPKDDANIGGKATMTDEIRVYLVCHFSFSITSEIDS